MRSVLECSKPENEKQLRSFIGAVTWYSRFIKNFSQITRPLNELLRQGKRWEWTRECKKCFETLKRTVCSAPILAHYNPNEETTVITDASPNGIGAVLTQGKEENPVIYVSRTLSSHEQNYSQIEREGLAIIYAFDRLRQYLLGRKFKLVTDNKPLAQCFKKKLSAVTTSRIQRWVIKLSEYDFQVEEKNKELRKIKSNNKR